MLLAKFVLIVALATSSIATTTPKQDYVIVRGPNGCQDTYIQVKDKKGDWSSFLVQKSCKI